MSPFGLETEGDLADARQKLLATVQLGIDAASANSAKWGPLKDWFTATFGEDYVPDRRAAEGKNITSEKQVWNRIHNELPGRDPKYAVITAMDPDLLPAVRRHLEKATLARARMALLLTGTDPVELQVYQQDDVTETAVAMFPELKVKYIDRPEHTGPGPIGPGSGPASLAQILVDDRIRRMVKLAIASTTAVILVGPPGTGKTKLLEEVIEEMRASPAEYGFPTLGPPLWATPEESWTTRELLGGLTVDENGLLRFREGHVLEAIRENRWLVLDETNRADMDKIFGGLMTWLSTNTEVNLGPVSTHFESPPVLLGWSTDADSELENESSLGDSEPGDEPVRFLAGTGWRLLGTYNALDAQRVFRFGAALGRRFARVPIPAPSVEMFANAVEPLAEGLPAPVGDGIVGLYASHLDAPSTELGPALFTRLPHYVRTGLGMPALVLPEDESGGDASETDATTTEAAVHDDAPAAAAHAAAGGDEVGPAGEVEKELADGDVDEPAAIRLLAEAYVISVGTWLTRLSDEDVDGLGERVVQKYSALPAKEWKWVVEMSSVLG